MQTVSYNSDMKKTYPVSIFWFLLVMLLLLSPKLHAEAAARHKNIYIINSYNHTSERIGPMVDKQLELLKEAYPLAEYFIYDMDNDRFDETIYDLVSAEIAVAAASYPADIVIADGYDAYFFSMDLREQFLADVPIVFSGITDLKGRVPDIPTGVTGIPDIIDIEGIIETALQLQPETEHLYLILDRRISSRKTLPSYLQQAIDRYQLQLNVKVLKNYSVAQVAAVLNRAEAHSIALMFPLLFNSDFDAKAGVNPYAAVTEQNRVPVYSFYEFAMNVGVMGGYIASGADYGRASAEFALRILGGESPNDIPVPESGFQDLILDHQVLEKFDIPTSRLPANAIVINKPDSFYQQNRQLVWFVSFVFLVLIATIISLSLVLVWRKKMTLEMAKLKSYLFSIIDSMPSAIISVDNNGRIQLYNEAAQKRTGISVKQAKDRLFTEVFPEYCNELENIKVSIATHKAFHDPNRVVNISDQQHYENITIFPLATRDAQDAVIRIDDVTQERELQEKLNHKDRMDAVGAVSAGIAHDFNNMLGGITGAVQVLQIREKGLSEKSKKMLDQIQSTAFSSAELVKKLMVFSKMRTIESTAIDLHQVIDDTVAILQRTIDKSIDFVITKDAAQSLIVGENSSLQTAVMNLGINASHAMEEGGTLSVSTANVDLNQDDCNRSTFNIEPGEYVVLKVGDTGTGIPVGVIEHIFEPFYTTKAENRGTGLGLSTVYGTIKDHQGAISVDSTIGAGTIFALFIPCAEATEIDKENENEVIPGKGRILLADDEELIRVTGTYLLEKIGYDVVTVNNGQDALDYYREQQESIDAIILDMVMPVMGGNKCFEKLKEINPACRVIIASGFSSRDTLEKMQQAGICGFIAKPYKDHELSKLLHEVLHPDS